MIKKPENEKQLLNGKYTHTYIHAHKVCSS